MDVDKLRQVFKTCDTKGTGFIGREDLHEICSTFGISDQESDCIFEDLDHDKDGRISFKDFAKGFSDFLSTPLSLSPPRFDDFKCDHELNTPEDERYLRIAKAEMENDSEREIKNILQSYKEELGEKGTLSEEKLLQLYEELQNSQKPQLVSHLESVIEDMMVSMKRLKNENECLEKSWKREREDHEKYLHRLEEEMDSQVQKVEETVKEQAKEEVETQRRQLKSQMNAEMDELQTHLKLFQKVDTWLKSNQDPEMDSKFKSIRTKLEDAVDENRQLRMNLMDTQTNIALMRSELSQVKTNYEEKCRELHDEKERVMEYMHEQDYLSRQLHLLHDANRRLQDTNDGLRTAIEQYPSSNALRSKRGSIIGTYLSNEADVILSEPPRSRKQSKSSRKSNGSQSYGSEGWEKTSRGSSRSRGSTMDSGRSTLRDATMSDRDDDDDEIDNMEYTDGNFSDEDPKEVGDRMKKRLISQLNIKPKLMQHSEIIIPLDGNFYDDEINQTCENCSCVPKVNAKKNSTDSNTEKEEPRVAKEDPPMPMKRTRLLKGPEPGMGFVGCIPEIEESAIGKVNSEVEAKPQNYESTGPPDRTYKIVFVGDAAVGKSSFIIRLSKGYFASNLSSTLGVDFQMKTLRVDETNIALQLWDTAGQERFRSITQSYFRRADGIMLLYDCTSERTFLNVREWVESIKDMTDRNIPVILCGNKTDLRETAIIEGRSVVRKEDGERLAQGNNHIFLETSAKDGLNVIESVVKLVRIMASNEDLELQSSGLKIEVNDKKKKSGQCCSK